MKNFKVTWYIGSVTDIKEPLKIETVQAKTIEDVNAVNILPESEAKRYAIDIKYGLRTIFLEEGKKHSFDYGSYSKFIMVEDI